MKRIQTVSDIEFLKETKAVQIEFINEIEQDFLNICEAEHEVVCFLDYRLSLWQALFVFEKGDDVLGKLNDPMSVEYVEKVVVEQLVYYRCAIRNEHDFQIYYSLIGIHDEEIENWLHENSE